MFETNPKKKLKKPCKNFKFRSVKKKQSRKISGKSTPGKSQHQIANSRKNCFLHPWNTVYPTNTIITTYFSTFWFCTPFDVQMSLDRLWKQWFKDSFKILKSRTNSLSFFKKFLEPDISLKKLYKALLKISKIFVLKNERKLRERDPNRSAPPQWSEYPNKTSALAWKENEPLPCIISTHRYVIKTYTSLLLNDKYCWCVVKFFFSSRFWPKFLRRFFRVLSFFNDLKK